MATVAEKVGTFFKKWKKDNGAVEVVRKDGEPGKEVSIQQVKAGYGEVMETMKSVRDHLDQQSQRSERMLTLLEDLPATLKSLPEATRQQTQALEAIRANLEKSNETTGYLTTAITGLSEVAGQQRESLDKMHQNMAEETVARQELRDGLSTLDATMGEVKAATDESRAAAVSLANESRGREDATRELFQRSQRMTLVFTVVSWALAIGAIVVAAYVGIKVSQMDTTPAPSTAAPVISTPATPQTPEAPAPEVTP
ncbi:MAG: hypothetical protein AAF797_14930 [Planctomycetota bacterium]